MARVGKMRIVAIPHNDVIDRLYNDFHTRPHWEVAPWSPTGMVVRQPPSFRSPQKHHRKKN